MQDNELQYDRIINKEISEEMKSSYIDYAMSVIVARALPDVRDGLKPVHRRILFAMNELNLDPSKAYKKCARIVGDTMGKYHPHGDASIYDALVRLAQDFSMRYPLVDGHGNFGSIDGYPAAAQRYTEAKLAKISVEMLADIDKNTVDFTDNYDGEFKEPSVLPSRFPNLLVNGSSGIAVGMATNIPPHNLNEIINGLIKIIDNKIEENRETEVDEIIEFIKGPDFPTGANILGKNGILSAYRTGKGKLKLRAEAEIQVLPNGREQILVTEIPYQVNKSRMIERIAELVKDKKIEGITGLTDSSYGDDIKIIIECRKDVSANIILNQLYKYSQMQETYSINLLAIVEGAPKVLNIKEMLEHYLKHQEEIVTRRTQFELDKALKRIHIVEGYVKALDNIDEVIRILRSSRTTNDAKATLMERFLFTEIQVNAICEMRFRSLTGLEREKLDKELLDLQIFIDEMQAILNDEAKLYALLKEEFLKTKAKYGDERRTRLIPDMGEIDMEDLIEDETSVITMTHLGYIKRLPLTTYKSQNRGGRGIMGMQTRDEDFVRDLFLSSNHSYVLLFTNLGKVFRMKTWEIPEAGRNAKGTALVNLLQLGEGEKINTVIPMKEFDDEQYLMMVTKHGVIKKTSANKFGNIRRSGLIAVGLRDNDELISVKKTDGTKDIFVATKNGMAIRFNESDVRPLSRTATGVRAINLNDDDIVIGAEVCDPEYKVLLVSENGYGKCTEIDNFKVQFRGGKGLKAYNITEKTGNVIGINMVNDNEELMIVTNEGVIIRIRVKEISTVGRVTQGVKLINVDEDINVMSIAKIAEEDIEEDDEYIEDEDNLDIDGDIEIDSDSDIDIDIDEE